MWTPADIEALPSAEDVEYAKKAIKELENLFIAAVEAVEQAKLRVVSLEREIKVRRAWVAPIRKLPVEILSEIFIYGSQMSRLMPITITEVSHHWRRVILATPKVWSIIELKNMANDDAYLSTFMERSDPCTMHMRVAPIKEDHNEYKEHLLLRMGESDFLRISCLSIPYRLLSYMIENVCPNLTHLTILEDALWATSYVDGSRFPRLRYFNTGDCRWLSADTMHSFPPLEYLTIDASSGPAYIEVIKGCSATLRGLEVKRLMDGPPQSAPVAIHFPLLEYLQVSPRHQYPIWPIQATTPALRSYREVICRTAQGILHKDVKTVTHLQCWEVPSLLPFFALRMLQIWIDQPPLELAEELKLHEEVCPSLKSIEFMLYSRIKETEPHNILMMIKAARPQLEVTLVETWSYQPGSRHDFECIHATWDKK